MSLITDLSTAAQIKAKVSDLYETTRAAHATLLASWEHGMDLIWAADSPAAILEEMGSGAGGIVAAHAATVSFLETFSPGCTAARMAQVLPYTVHENGTVTLNS